MTHTSLIEWPVVELSPLRIISDLDIIMRVIAVDGTYLVSEGGALAQIGRTPGDIVGESVFDVMAGNPVVLADIRRALAGEAIHTTREINGRVWEARYSPLYEGDKLIGTMYVAMNITARVRAEEALRESEARLRHQATHDALTGVLNRSYFLELLTHTLARATTHGAERRHAEQKQSAVLFLDLDGFKRVNDHQGHAAGDAVLIAAAQRLRRCVRSSRKQRADDAIARFGGDEFIVLLQHIPSVEAAAQVAERIVTALGEPIPLAQSEAHISASIGIALSGTGGASVTVDTIIQAADTAMYVAKRSGAGQYAVAVT